MDRIKQLFDRMDTWRHLPNYQLERRADLFFSLYLPEMLETKLGFPVQQDLIPEFPVRIGTIYPHIHTNKSFKIDYVAFSQNADKVVFVELKTDGASRRTKQDRYLEAARDTGLAALLEGLMTIFRASDSKRKYFHLLDRLAQLGLLEIPDSMREIVSGTDLEGINDMSREVRITCSPTSHDIVYLQPTDNSPVIISFDEFKGVVARHNDILSQRFAQSLAEWARVLPGKGTSNQLFHGAR
jgi:hypothetical protein